MSVRVRAVWVLAVAVLVTAGLSVVSSRQRTEAFCNQDVGISFIFPSLECPGNAGGHKDITSTALSFIREDVRAEIISAHIHVDTWEQFTGGAHFDGCEFKEGASRINTIYSTSTVNPAPLPSSSVLPGVVPGLQARVTATNATPLLPAFSWGRLLHTAQDFYSHSNWVEARRTALIDSGLKQWDPLMPFSIHDGAVLVQGETDTLPTGWSVSPGVSVLVPSANDGMTTYKGIISGTNDVAGDIVPDDCPDNVALPHSHLNKDAPGRVGYTSARAFAEQQTRHEWCRLLNLLYNAGGYPAVSVPMGLWVDPAGDPHPSGKPCGPAPPGKIGRTVTITNLTLLDDTDNIGAGEMNFPFTLYTGDFRRSVRTEVNNLSLNTGNKLTAGDARIPGPLTICLKEGDTLVITLQGWDDDNATAAFDGKLDSSDESLAGLTLSFGGPGFGLGTQMAESEDLRATFEVTESTCLKPLLADFSFSPTAPTVGKPVKFTPAISGGTTPYTCAWDVGKNGSVEGTSCTTFTTSFPSKGSSSVDLKVTDANGRVVTKNKQVTVAAQPLLVDFSISPTAPTVGKPVKFTPAISGGTTPYTCAWDVGKNGSVEGTSCTTFTTSFPTKGSVSVALRVTDANGTVVTKNKPVTVAAQPLVASIVIVAKPERAKLPQRFRAQVSGGTLPYTCEWDANKDNVVDLRDDCSGEFTFTPIGQGKFKFSVSLKVTDANGTIVTDSHSNVKIGGIYRDVNSGVARLNAEPSSGAGAWLLTGAIGASIAVVALGGAAWRARRRVADR